MHSKNILSTLAAFICFVSLCLSSEDVVDPMDSIKDQTLDMTVVCIESKNELNEIWNEIDRDESVDLGTVYTYSTACNELDKIKTGFLKLKYTFEELTKQPISSIKYEKMKASYEEQIRALIKRLDDEKRTSKGKALEIVGKLKNDFQKQQDKINEALKQLEKEQKALNMVYVRLCVENIDRTEFGAAVHVFKNITNYKKIKTIVSASYSTKPENFEKIVTFVRQVADAEPMLIGYTALFEEMVKQNQLRDQRILILANEIRTNTNPIFKELKTMLMAMVDTLVQENYFEGFINYANAKGVSKDVDFVQNILRMIVEMVYNKPTGMIFGDDPRNVEFLISLLPKFSYMEHQLYIMNDLVTVMIEAGHREKPSMLLVISKTFEFLFKLLKDTK